MDRKVVYYSNELYHYGVPGQKWGVRNYQNEDGSYVPGEEGRYYDPVSGSKRKSSKSVNRVEKNNSKKVNNSSKKEEAKKKFELSDKQKKALKIGAAVAATALAAYATYKVVDMVKDKKAIEAGMHAYNSTLRDRNILEGLVKDAESRRGDAWQQHFKVGNQEFTWTNYRNHPELIPEHLKDSTNSLLERSYFEGETPQEAFDRVYNSLRKKR